MRAAADPGFGARLRTLEDEHQKTCDKDAGARLHACLAAILLGCCCAIPARGRPAGSLPGRLPPHVLTARTPCPRPAPAGGCGALWPVSHDLTGPPPRVFSLGLVWASQSEEPGAIAATLRAVGETVRCGRDGQGKQAERGRAPCPPTLLHAGPAPAPACLPPCLPRPSPPQVDLSQLYGGVPPGARYSLRSMACYYGRHYSAFVRLPELHNQ